MERSEILRALRSHVEKEFQEKGTGKSKRLKQALEFITEEKTFFGKEPQYFIACMECNSTAVGRSSFGGTETQRTIARDYVTDQYLFIDGHIGAGEKGLSLFYLKKGETVNYYAKKDIEKLATHYGRMLHAQYFHDLNITLYSHRLNRFKTTITKGPFSYPIRPIMATINEHGDCITIGYIYEVNGKEQLIIEPEDPDKTSDAGCLSWIRQYLPI